LILEQCPECFYQQADEVSAITLFDGRLITLIDAHTNNFSIKKRSISAALSL
jgi:hypothetical protein